MMSETIVVGVAQNFWINLEVLSAHFMQFFIFGAKNYVPAAAIGRFCAGRRLLRAAKGCGAGISCTLL